MGINRVCGRPVASWAASSTAQSLVTKQHWGEREESSDCHLPPTRGVHQPLQHPGSLQKCWLGTMSSTGKGVGGQTPELLKEDITYTRHVQAVLGVAQISTHILSRALELQK